MRGESASLACGPSPRSAARGGCPSSRAHVMAHLTCGRDRPQTPLSGGAGSGTGTAGCGTVRTRVPPMVGVPRAPRPRRGGMHGQSPEGGFGTAPPSGTSTGASPPAGRDPRPDGHRRPRAGPSRAAQGPRRLRQEDEAVAAPRPGSGGAGPDRLLVLPARAGRGPGPPGRGPEDDGERLVTAQDDRAAPAPGTRAAEVGEHSNSSCSATSPPSAGARRRGRRGCRRGSGCVAQDGDDADGHESSMVCSRRSSTPRRPEEPAGREVGPVCTGNVQLVTDIFAERGPSRGGGTSGVPPSGPGTTSWTRPSCGGLVRVLVEPTSAPSGTHWPHPIALGLLSSPSDHQASCPGARVR